MTKKAKPMSRKEREAIRLARRIVEIGGSQAVLRIQRVHDRIERRKRNRLMPMAAILAKIPWPSEDTTLTAKARRLGITRQTWYDWVNERFRPNIQQATKLSELTGLTIKDIRGVE